MCATKIRILKTIYNTYAPLPTTEPKIFTAPGKEPHFYPASGFRNSGSGSLIVVSTYGYAWSNSANSTTSVGGTSLSFSSSDMHPEHYDYRASGFPVRCVQE